MRSLGLLKVAGRGRGIPEVRSGRSLERGGGIGRSVEDFAYMIKISPCFLACYHMPFSLDFSTIRKHCIPRDLPGNCFLPSAPE